MRFRPPPYWPALLLFCGLVLPHMARATITVTDMASRQVTLAAPPQRIALQDGRVALDLALLDRAQPFARVVAWNNLLRRFEPNQWSVLVKNWPAAAKIPDMGFDDNGSVNLEELIAARPQLLVAELRARPVLEQQGVMRTLAQLGIPVLFVDDSEHPVPDAARSVTLLGQVLGREAEAKAYVDFQRFQHHRPRISGQIHLPAGFRRFASRSGLRVDHRTIHRSPAEPGIARHSDARAWRLVQTWN